MNPINENELTRETPTFFYNFRSICVFQELCGEHVYILWSENQNYNPMKISQILLFLLLPLYTTYGQQAVIGSIETYDGATINLHAPKNGNRKINFSGMAAGCDCMVGRGKVLYHDAQGKLGKISQKEVKKLTLNEGLTYCRPLTQDMASGNSVKQILDVKLPAEMTLIGLPVKKNGKLRLLHQILLQNDRYLLSMYSRDDGFSSVFIFTAKDHRYIGGSYAYQSIGYGGEGKKGYEKIKQYFKDCPEMLADMEKLKKENKEAGLFGKKPLLFNVHTIGCK